MRYVALACDYDGTLAWHGRVSDDVVDALGRVRDANRALILVTGRELDDLRTVFPCLDLFDRVVVENGALLYRPSTDEERTLGERPPAAFVSALQAQGVRPLGVGHVIVSTEYPNEVAVLEVIRELGLELEVVFNKGAVMVLPPGINKASGLLAALHELGLSAHNAVSIGDAENDHSLLRQSECGVAVANALPLLKERADFVTAGENGAGVLELANLLVADDLRSLALGRRRHEIRLGVDRDGREVGLPAYGPAVLFVGPSESGKTTAAMGLVESLAEQGYQFCLVDPEGDYEPFAQALVLGDCDGPPAAEQVLEVLADPDINAIVNLMGLRLSDRPAYFAALLPRLEELRAKVGRPHWIVVDEAHHVLPSESSLVQAAPVPKLESAILITVRPETVRESVLRMVDTVVAVGKKPGATLRDFARAIGEPPPRPRGGTGRWGNALVWSREADLSPFSFTTCPPRAAHRRHRRKYAEGDLGEDDSFYFRGPANELNLRARNLNAFAQLAAGVDDATWLYHLQRGDYSRWIRTAVKDKGLANDAATVERDRGLSAAESRARVAAAIEERYTLPA